jgi:hypothetical protein
MSLTVTYSALSKFNSCPKKYDFRYVQGLVPRDEDPALWFGSAIHECLQALYEGVDRDMIMAAIDARYPLRFENADQRRDWHYCRAMMRAYFRVYPVEPFIPSSPIPFDDPIIERSFSHELAPGVYLRGKVDGVVEVLEPCADLQVGFYLLEHKTSSNPDEFYWSSRWADMQTAIYSWAIEKAYDCKLNGVIYNVLAKPRIKQTGGETIEEYNERYAEAVAKSKNGKTAIKQKKAETDEEFESRLDAWYQEEPRLMRRVLNFDREIIADAVADATAGAEAIKKGLFCRRSSGCMEYNRPCEYMPICRPGHNPDNINLYEKKAAHSELEGTAE